MGLFHSTPVPNEDDFLFVHGPPSPSLCEEEFPPKRKYETYSFFVDKNAWSDVNKNRRNRETLVKLSNDDNAGAVLRIVPMHPSEDGVQQYCAVYLVNTRLQEDEAPSGAMDNANDANEQAQQPTPIAVLRIRNNEEAQICSLTPCRPNQRSTAGGYQGQPLYKWAVVERRKESYQFNMRTVFDSVRYTTEYVGPILSCKNRKSRLALKRQGLFCATLKEPKWTCNVGPGIDPVLIVCFVLCMGKIRECEKKRLEAAHYNTSYRTSNIM